MARASDQEKLTKQGFDLISMFGYPMESKGQAYILEHHSEYAEIDGVGNQEIQAYLSDVVFVQQQMMMQTNDYSGMPIVIERLAPHLAEHPDQLEESIFELKAFFLLEGQQFEQYIELVDRHYPEVSMENFDAFYALVNHHLLQKVTDNPSFNAANVRWAIMLHDYRATYETKFSHGIALYRAGQASAAVEMLKGAKDAAQSDEDRQNIQMIIQGISEG